MTDPARFFQEDLFADASGADGAQALDVRGGDVRLWRSFIPDADRMLAALLDEIELQQDEIVLFGKRSPIPRLTAWYGEPGCSYTYSGVRMDPTPWTRALVEIRSRVVPVAAERFTSVLCNLYRDGRDGVAWHADDEAELGPEPVIASVSLGAERRFVLRRVDAPSERAEVVVGHGDLLVMAGATQRLWQHQVPRTARPVGPRLNLTFRRIRPS